MIREKLREGEKKDQVPGIRLTRNISRGRQKKGEDEHWFTVHQKETGDKSLRNCKLSQGGSPGTKKQTSGHERVRMGGG